MCVTVGLVFAAIFFIMELVVLFYGINIALSCTKTLPERVVNICFAIIFTMPYVLFNTLFNKCANYTLHNKSSLHIISVP